MVCDIDAEKGLRRGQYFRGRVARRVVIVLASCVVGVLTGWCLSDSMSRSISRGYGRAAAVVSDVLVNAGLGINEVVISGNSVVAKESILSLIDTKRPIVFVSLDRIGNSIKSAHKWVKNVTITRMLTGKLRIDIEEYVAFANWHHNGLNSIIDNTGHVIIDSEHRLDNLVSIHGDGDVLGNLHFVREVLDGNTVLGTMASSFFWLGNRRWDVFFSSGLQVKFPEHNPWAAWNYLLSLYRDSGGHFLMWKIVDMRVPDKVFVKK